MSELKTPADVVKFIKEEKVEIVDLRFMDFPGLWQHFSVPPREIEEETFEEGLGFDGSSIRGWQAINESDMLVKPVPETAFLDPFLAAKTLIMICNICDPVTGEDYTRDPRNIARKAENYLKSLGLADTAYFGPEAEFFIFDDIRFDQNEHEGYYHIDSVEGRWNTGRVESPNLGYKPRYKEGYFPVPPTDSQQDIRSEMVLTLEKMGIRVEAQHHEVATGGQAEIDMRFMPLVEMADKLLMYKYVIKNTARKHNKTVTFMPKPLFNDNGSGMHTHLSLWKGGENLFAGDEYAGLSDMALLRDRRSPEACAVAAGLHEPDHEQLQAARPRVRGAGEPGLLEAKPKRGHSNPDVLHLAQGEAHRVPLPGPELQPVPGLFGHADGGHRRHPEQDRPGRVRSTRTSTIFRPRNWPRCRRHPGSLREALECARSRPRLPAQGRRVHRRT